MTFPVPRDHLSTSTSSASRALLLSTSRSILQRFLFHRNRRTLLRPELFPLCDLPIRGRLLRDCMVHSAAPPLCWMVYERTTQFWTRNCTCFRTKQHKVRNH